MSKPAGLQRKVMLYMSVVGLGGLAISVIGWVVVYALFVTADAQKQQLDGAFLPIDYAAMVVFGVCSVVLAAGAARSLSRRLVAPITAVAAAARRISAGEQSARANVEANTPTELVSLADDFNAMAERLQLAADDERFWNAAIAHELRTPVTVLRGRLQGAMDGVFSLDDRLLSALMAQVDALAKLIEDLRVVSLAESGHLMIEHAPLDLAQVVDTVRLSMDAPLRDAGFAPEWTSSSTMVRADPARLYQALLVLLENARRHASRGPLVCEAATDGDVAVLRVIDVGPGVDPELATKIFDRFRRASTNTPGSGLGLAVVKAIAEAHGGEARCRPAPNGGSIFEIALPLLAPLSLTSQGSSGEAT